MPPRNPTTRAEAFVRHLSIVALSVFTLACASGAIATAAAQADSMTPAAAPAPAPEKSKPTKSDPNHLSSDEITAANRPTTYDVVDHLRRAWLRKDMLTGEEVVVYMDEQNIGGADKLRDIPTVDVAELQYLPNKDAVKRWGSQIKGSVIVVSRKR
jgi:DNA uptake protein ComE-like DNA-binding protein